MIESTRQIRRWVQDVVKRRDGMTGFLALPKRWIVEPTFSWLCRYRRLSKDYGTLPKSSESVIKLAMTHLMVRRLRPRSM